MSEKAQKYSPEQIAELEKSRTISDAELLKGGAKYVVDKEMRKRLELDKVEYLRSDDAKSVEENERSPIRKQQELNEKIIRSLPIESEFKILLEGNFTYGSPRRSILTNVIGEIKRPDDNHQNYYLVVTEPGFHEKIYDKIESISHVVDAKVVSIDVLTDENKFGRRLLITEVSADNPRKKANIDYYLSNRTEVGRR